MSLHLQDKTERLNENAELNIANSPSVSEAEKRLNFNLMPNKQMQKKIDYFLTPYNKHKMITKFMSFENLNKDADQNLSETSKEKWNKISNLILGKDKKAFRKALFCINNKLYIELGNTLNKQNNQYIDFEELQNLAKMPSERNNSPINRAKTSISKRSKFINRRSCRDSIMSVMINKIRVKKESSKNVTKPKTSHGFVFNIFNQFLKRSPSLNAKLKSRYESSSLKSIPECMEEKINISKISKCFSSSNLSLRRSNLRYNEENNSDEYFGSNKDLLIKTLLEPKLEIKTKSLNFNESKINCPVKLLSRLCSSSKTQEESESEDNSSDSYGLKKDSKSDIKCEKKTNIYSRLTIVPHKINHDDIPSCPLPLQFKEQILSLDSSKELKRIVSSSRGQRKISSRCEKRVIKEKRTHTPRISNHPVTKRKILAFI